MARLIGPDMGSRAVFLPSGAPAAGRTGVVYADAAGTVLADVRVYDGTATPGAAYADSLVTVDAYGLLPLVWFPAGDVDRLYITVNGGPLTPIDADYNARLDTVAAVATAAETPTGAQAKASAAQAAAITDATTKYASVAQLPASTGVDDTATINAVLAASAGRRVRGLPGQTYLISAPLVIYSGTELDMTGCTVTLKANSNCNMLQNAAVAATGTRDTGITVVGGSWVRTAPNGGTNGWDLHTLRFRRADGLVVRDLTVNTLSGKYAISLGDVTDAKIRDITLSAFSDGVHLTGPAYRTHISHIRGTTADDSVAITPRDWPAYDDVSGPVEDTLIEDVYTTSTAARLVKVLGGSATTAARRTVVRRVGGTAALTAIIAGDDTAQANTTGGLVDDLLIQDVRATCPAGQSLIALNGRNMSRVRVSGVEFDNAAATAAVVNYVPTAVATLDSLVVERLRVKAIGAAPVIRVDLNATVSRMLVDGVDVVSTTSGTHVLQVRTVVTDLIMRSVTAALTGSSNVLHLNGSDSAAQVARASLDGIHATGTGGALVNSVTSTHVLPRLEIANVVLSGTAWIADLATVTELHLSNVTTLSPGAGVMNVRATAAITVRGAGLNLALGAQNIAVAAGGTVTSRTFALECDLADLQRTANSMAYNTNAALSCGVGPVVSDGTTWKHLHTGLTY